jgi:hypothetical protein
MRSNNSIDQTATQNAVRPFTIQAKAVDPAAHFKMAAVFVLALLTIIAAGTMSMYPSKASQAEELTTLTTQGLTAMKSDRAVKTGSGNKCDAQAWGAWSAECAAAISGASKVRKVSFVTVEKSSPSVNETILARYPAAN